MFIWGEHFYGVVSVWSDFKQSLHKQFKEVEAPAPKEEKVCGLEMQQLEGKIRRHSTKMELRVDFSFRWLFI